MNARLVELRPRNLVAPYRLALHFRALVVVGHRASQIGRDDFEPDDCRCFCGGVARVNSKALRLLLSNCKFAADEAVVDSSREAHPAQVVVRAQHCPRPVRLVTRCVVPIRCQAAANKVVSLLTQCRVLGVLVYEFVPRAHLVRMDVHELELSKRLQDVAQAAASPHGCFDARRCLLDSCNSPSNAGRVEMQCSRRRSSCNEPQECFHDSNRFSQG